MKVFERYTLEYKRSPVHQFQQRISLTCCLGFRISPRSCNAFPNPEEPGEEDEDVQAERMRTAGAVTALQINEVVLIKTSFLSSANNSASLARNIPILILLKVWWGRRALLLFCSLRDVRRYVVPMSYESIGNTHTPQHNNLLICFSES